MVNRTRRLMVPLLLSYLIFACLSIIAAVIFVEQTDYLTENRELTDFLLLILIIYTMSFIILATVIITIFRSIRKISLATAAYAVGNFDVRIESKSIYSDYLSAFFDIINIVRLSSWIEFEYLHILSSCCSAWSTSLNISSIVLSKGVPV